MSAYRILIITRSFAPDGIIATVRPSKMAKYLSLYGHDVTVIRSGRIFGKGDLNNLRGLENVTIYSYDGPNSDAERLERGEELNNVTQKKETAKKNSKIRRGRIGKIIHFFYDPIQSYIRDGIVVRKRIMELYNRNEHIRNFDVVISTFSPLGSIQAGKTISRKENCKWIIDFRDLMDNTNFTAINRLINSIRQKHFVKIADACLCVSEGNTQRLIAQNKRKNTGKIYCVFNGYEESKQIQPIKNIQSNKQELHICYTGTLYNGKRDCSPLLKVLREMGSSLPVIIDYAGRDGDVIFSQAQKYGVGNIIINHGYLSRTEVAELQSKSDFFLVLSWNTKRDQGIITGKFYEALQNKKPIIALVNGDQPNSELKVLIDRYHLGVCYEEATKEKSERELRYYLDKQISRKQYGETMEYNPDESVFSRFQYQEIAKQLEHIISEIV